ncbi:MAG: hypothetical protein QXP81_08515 [Nitrososphaerota archaeon]
MRNLRPRRSRAGLEAPIVALILVLIGVALALLVGVMVFSRAGVFAQAESIKVIEAAAYDQGSCIYVVAKVKNDGTAQINSISVTVRFGLTSPQTVGSVGNLQPGSEGSTSNCVPLEGAQRGQMVVVEASGRSAVSGNTVSHATQVPVA